MRTNLPRLKSRRNPLYFGATPPGLDLFSRPLPRHRQDISEDDANSLLPGPTGEIPGKPSAPAKSPCGQSSAPAIYSIGRAGFGMQEAAPQIPCYWPDAQRLRPKSAAGKKFAGSALAASDGAVHGPVVSAAVRRFAGKEQGVLNRCG